MTVYVTMNDSFMSGWGHAEGLTNKLIFICADMAEAQTVAENAEARSDMKRINISVRKPNYYRARSGTDYRCGQYYVQVKTRDDYPSWYQPGYFGGK